jgi:ubiquinone/menaquinone biosynthesis C-methylase UbiE
MSDDPRARNRSYWNEQARNNAMWHISHSESEEGFVESGRKDVYKFFGPDLKAVPRGGRVLEIGCGIGRLMEPLAKMCPETQFFGVDVSTEMVRGANDRLRGQPNGFVFRTTGDSLDMFDDGYFDLVYSMMVFQHLPQRVFKEYAQEVARILVPGGTFRFQVQYDAEKNGLDSYPANDFRSIRYYGITELERLLPSSLKIVAYPTDVKSARMHDYYVTSERARESNEAHPG